MNSWINLKNVRNVLQFYMIIQDREQFLIEQLSSRYIGDDAAVVDGMIYSVDAFFEGTHFRREWMSLEQIARKSLLVNFSDAVAMNALPRYALLSLSIPRGMQTAEIERLMAAFQDTAAEFDCEIIGGDTIGGEKLHISVTVISQSDNPLYRRGLQSGDLLAFTGTLGESRRDLERLFGGEKIAADSKFYEPILRQEFITRARPFLRVGMDISDGLFCDTNKLLDINRYGVDILKNIDDFMGSSGEEYEMLVGFDPEHLERLYKIAEATRTPLTVFAKTSTNDLRFACKSHHFG